jgi:hypothetical protein
VVSIVSCFFFEFLALLCGQKISLQSIPHAAGTIMRSAAARCAMADKPD